MGMLWEGQQQTHMRSDDDDDDGETRWQPGHQTTISMAWKGEGKGRSGRGGLEKLHAFKLKFQTESRSGARNRPWIQKHRDNKPGHEQPHGCLLLLVALLFRPLAPGHIFLVSYHFYSQFAAANQQMNCHNTLRIRRVALCSFVRKCSLPVYFREILEELP